MVSDFLQSLKLEISKSFSLITYERIAFHKILGILKTEHGMNILLRDLQKRGLVRKSALSVIKDFADPQVTEALVLLLKEKITEEEFLYIVEHLDVQGTQDHAPVLREIIDVFLQSGEHVTQLHKAIHALGSIGRDLVEINDYFKQKVVDRELSLKYRISFLESIEFMPEISFMDDLLKENNDAISQAVFKKIAELIDNHLQKARSDQEDDFFTKTPDQEDRLLLDVRVLLGKMTIHFDTFSNQTKASFVLAMILCGHREFIIYTLKSLTAKDDELIDFVLFTIYNNVEKIKNPDKLFRSLIAHPSVTNRDDDLIVEIFVKYFSSLKESRSNLLMKDKIYNYIVVMVDSYFENYRKNFMIPEIMEKDYPEQFQKIRGFVLRQFTPELKRKIVTLLNTNDEVQLKHALYEMAEKSPYIDESDLDALHNFVEVLYEKDQKVRQISASRIDSIDFEKRYLRNRIVRLCRIIGRLRINEASTNLVKIFNYVKKYYDKDIYNAATYTLSVLHYPYMLGELEVLLFSGDEKEKEWAVNLLSLYTDQRSLNILLDYVKDNFADESGLIEMILKVVLDRDVVNNMAVNEVTKKIIENDHSTFKRRLAVHLLGKCAQEHDISYLNDLFYKAQKNEVKEGIVQAIDYIVEFCKNIDTREATVFLKDYLKDPGIKVRIHACATLLQLGNKDVLRSIREMMIIKNKNIQREILLIISKLMSPDLAYFLISLLKEEYAISGDIIPLLGLLPAEDLKEIDHFIVNIFKKYEGMGSEYSYAMKTEQQEKMQKELKHFKQAKVSILALEICNYSSMYENLKTAEFPLNFNMLFEGFLHEIHEHGGIISSAAKGKIISYYGTAIEAAQVGLSMLKLARTYNATFLPDEQLHVYMYLATKEIDIINDELIVAFNRDYMASRLVLLHDKILTNTEEAERLEHSFKCISFPRAIFNYNGFMIEYKEVDNPLNFMMTFEDMTQSIHTDAAKRKEMEKQVEESVKNRDRHYPKAVQLAKSLDDVGKILKGELANIQKYVSKRSTDRELIHNVEKMLANVHKRYVFESSKILIE